MYSKAIKYGVYGWLAPGSDAFEMYHAKKFTELKRHLEKLDEDKHVLEGATREQAKAHTRSLNEMQTGIKTERVLEAILKHLPEVSDAPEVVGSIVYDDSELDKENQ